MSAELIVKTKYSNEVLQSTRLKGDTLFENVITFSVKDFGVKPDETVSLLLTATDTGGQTGRARPVELIVTDGQPAGTALLAARLREALTMVREEEKALRRSSRSFAELARSFRADDPAARRGKIVVTVNQVKALFQPLMEATRIMRETAGNPVLDTRLAGCMLEVTERYSEWHQTRKAILTGAAERAGMQKLTTSDPFATAGNLCHAGVGELQVLLSELGLMVARIEAEGLVVTTASADKRQKRLTPLLIGYYGWSRGDTRAEPGLFAQFYRGNELAGKPVYACSGVVDITNFSVPGLGSEDWSVSYQGELHIPVNGNYTISCTADDGVRVTVDGKKVAGDEAWKHQYPTAYTATLSLTAGWHPIDIKMFQGKGGSQLLLAMAPKDTTVKRVEIAELRHQVAANTNGMVRLMAEFPREIALSAERRIRHDLRVMTVVPAALKRMQNDCGSGFLTSLISRAGPIGATLTSTLNERIWERHQLQAAGDKAHGMPPIALEARSLLDTHIGSAIERDRLPPGRINAIIRAVNRLNKDLVMYAKTEVSKSGQKRESLLKNAREMMQAELEEMKKSLAKTKASMRERAGNVEAGLAERQSAFAALRELDRKLGKDIAAVDEILSDEKKHKGLQNTMAQPLAAISNKLKQAALHEARADISKSGAIAGKALALLNRLADKDSLVQAEAESGFRKEAEKFAEARGAAGDFKSMNAANDAVTKEQPQQLKSLLDHFASQDKDQQWQLYDHMKNKVAELKKEQTEARQQLGDLGLMMRLTAEEREKHANENEAAAYRRAERQLGELTSDKPDIAKLEKIAQDIGTMEGRHGDKNKLVTEAREEQRSHAGEKSILGEAERLSNLAKAMDEAAGNKTKQADVRKQLAASTEKAAGRIEAGAQRKHAEALGSLMDQINKQHRKVAGLQSDLAAVKSRARKAGLDLARAEGAIARELKGMEKTAKQLAADDQSMSDALQKAAAGMAQAAGKAEELSRAVGKNEETGKEAAAQATKHADSIRDGIAAPLAQAYLARAGKKSKSWSSAGKLGAKLAGLAAQHRHSAEAMLQGMQEESGLQKKLDQALSAARALNSRAAQATGEAEAGGKPPSGKGDPLKALAATESKLGTMQKQAAASAGTSAPPTRAESAAAQAQQMLSAAPDNASAWQKAAKTLSKAASAMRMAAPPGTSPGTPTGQAASSSAGVGEIVADPGRHDEADDEGIDAGWARLEERLRTTIRSGGAEDFSEEYRHSIREYFRLLGEK